MYMDNNDTLTPRDRIGDDMLRRMLEPNGFRGAEERPLPDLPPSENSHNHNHNHNHDHDQSSCMPRNTWGLRDHPVGMVYAPLQEFRHLYDRDTALRQGTIFRELDLPFLGESVANGGACRKGGACHG